MKNEFTCLVAWSVTLLTSLTGCSKPAARVVLFCAQDREFAQAVLGDFRHGTGLEVVPKFDTEADKSVSLYVELVQDKARPRCDVFWNNEILSTLRLQKQGLLEPHDSPAAAPYPASARAGDHTWHAFAARARVLIVNTDLVEPAVMPRSLFDLADPRWRGQVVMARPQFGTSATQAACLFEVLGSNQAKEYYRALKGNAVQLAPGNKQAAEWVGRGRTPAGAPAALGITDTDDALAEVQAKRPVALVFADGDGNSPGRMGSLFIPNTVAIIKGGPNPEGARKLVDFLLSPGTERALAQNEGHQIPLNPGVAVALPAHLKRPGEVKAMEVDFDRAADLWGEVQTFLREEFARP